MVKAVIVCCEKIRDTICKGCARCFKAIADKAGKFGEFDEVQIVAWTSCGGCPGLVIPKLNNLDLVLKQIGVDYDVVFIASCIVKAVKTGYCRIDIEKLAKDIEEETGKKVVIGTKPPEY